MTVDDSAVINLPELDDKVNRKIEWRKTKKEKHSPALGAQIYCQEIGIGDKDLLIQRTKIGAGAEIGAFQVVCPEGIPCAGAEDGFLWHIVHEYRDAQHSSQ